MSTASEDTHMLRRGVDIRHQPWSANSRDRLFGKLESFDYSKPRVSENARVWDEQLLQKIRDRCRGIDPVMNSLPIVFPMTNLRTGPLDG